MKESKPITVLMPVYNGEQYLREAIDSILNQTFADFEFLIVNDGSTDRTEEIIRSYNDPRIVLITQANGGVSKALNTGLNHARGTYIARFDADDICFPERLKEQYEFMLAHPEYVLIGSDAEYVGQNGEFIFNYYSNGHTNEEINERIFSKNPFIHSVVFFPLSVVVEHGAYDPKAHTFEDHLLWVKIIKKGKVCNFRKPLIKVRLNPESVTTDERLRGKRFLEIREQILKSGQPITDEQERELLEIIKSQNSHQTKKLGYHLFVAKKYLWNNYNPRLARQHILTCIKLRPSYKNAYFLLALSFLPKLLIVKLYQSVK
jgi:glycosyltransferase involved in cell wall biosynthesis